MKIIHDLAKASVKNRENSLAILSSILIAVIMMGTLLFIYSDLELSQWKSYQEMFGDYHAMLINIDEEEYRQLQENADIKTLELSKGIFLENVPFQRRNVDLYLQTPALLNSCTFGLFQSRLLQGRLPQQSDEILVSETFVLENPDYSLGKAIGLGSKNYRICGVFKEHLMSFNKNYLFFGQLSWEDPTALFQTAGGVDATIWFKNERDTYPLMRQILQDLGRKSEDDLLREGGLNYNTGYLEGKLIFKSGLIPSREFIERWSLRVGLLVCMLALFVVMIYNAFNVWSSQDLRQIALLKSTGMTPRQVRRLVIEKAVRLSLRPILLGLILAYGLTNVLFYLMWLNEKNLHLYRPIRQFQMVTPNPFVFITLFLLALLCVFLAAFRPARRSSRLSIIDAMKGAQPHKSKLRLRFTSDSKNIARSLAKDNSVSYRRTFRGLALSMALAGMVFSTVLIAQSQRDLKNLYDKPDSPYTLTSLFFTVQRAPRNLLAELKEIPDIRASHVFTSYDFRYLPADNQDFISDQLQASLHDEATRRTYRPKVTVFGLEDADFQMVLEQNGFSASEHEGFLLLDQTAQNPYKAYKHRTYIPLSQSTATTLVVQDSKDNERYHLPITGRLDEFPFELHRLWSDQIALFTSMTELEDFRLMHDKVDEYHSIVYRIKVAADLEVLPQVTQEVMKTLHNYIPKTDTSTRNQLSELAGQEEQYRNELILTLGAQILFVIIGLSNAYNSFHMNLKARTRDFALLRSAGMTEDQMKKMLHYEGFFLIRRVMSYYVLMLAGGVFALAAKNRFMFSPWQLAFNLDFPLLILFFLVSVLGIWAAMASGKRKVLQQSIITALQQDY